MSLSPSKRSTQTTLAREPSKLRRRARWLAPAALAALVLASDAIAVLLDSRHCYDPVHRSVMVVEIGLLALATIPVLVGGTLVLVRGPRRDVWIYLAVAAVVGGVVWLHVEAALECIGVALRGAIHGLWR